MVADLLLEALGESAVRPLGSLPSRYHERQLNRAGIAGKRRSSSKVRGAGPGSPGAGIVTLTSAELPIKADPELSYNITHGIPSY